MTLQRYEKNGRLQKKYGNIFTRGLSLVQLSHSSRHTQVLSQRLWVHIPLGKRDA